MEVSLHPQPGGDVAGLVEGPDDRARLVAQRRIGDLPGGLHTVEVAELLDHREGLARQRPVHQRSENDGLLGREQREQILTDPLLVAHDAQEVVAMRPVEPDHPVVTVEARMGDMSDCTMSPNRRRDRVRSSTVFSRRSLTSRIIAAGLVVNHVVTGPDRVTITTHASAAQACLPSLRATSVPPALALYPHPRRPASAGAARRHPGTGAVIPVRHSGVPAPGFCRTASDDRSCSRAAVTTSGRHQRHIGLTARGDPELRLSHRLAMPVTRPKKHFLRGTLKGIYLIIDK